MLALAKPPVNIAEGGLSSFRGRSRDGISYLPFPIPICWLPDSGGLGRGQGRMCMAHIHPRLKSSPVEGEEISVPVLPFAICATKL
jgi:hypothetical protein